jgi:DNA-binding CsgD family transcriptional regulator
VQRRESMTSMGVSLVDKIYECCFVPEYWPDVLDQLGHIANGPGASLFVVKNDTRHFTASPEPRERARRMVDEDWLRRGTIVARLFAQRHSGFLIDVDFLSVEELDREPIYRDMWRPLGIGWSMATAIPIATGENTMIVLSRRTEDGPFEHAAAERLDELRPHLARSVMMSARLGLERARMAGEALAALGIPALVMDEAGKVLDANTLIESSNEYLTWRAFDRIRLKDVVADCQLSNSIADPTGGAAVRSFPMRNESSGALMVGHVVPIRLSARDIFVRCAFVFAMMPLARPQAPPVELVQSLFDLTAAEARVARSLTLGLTVEEIASEKRVSPHTIRSHVRGVIEKTGSRRQADVIALLRGVSTIGG